MKKQTFIDNTTARGYEIAPPSQTGNVTATKGATTVRWLRTDHEKTYVETFRLLDYLVQP